MIIHSFYEGLRLSKKMCISLKYLAILNYVLLVIMILSIFMKDDKAIDISADLFKNAMSGLLALLLNDK